MGPICVPVPALVALVCSQGILADTQMNEHRVKSSTADGIEIYVRERLPAGKSPAEAKKAVLFVHGATYPGSSFDTDLADGKSWMDHVAEAGYAAYYLDHRGYGQSTRPALMDQPAEKNEPFAEAETVVKDLADVVDFIQERTGQEKINLVGYSWGTITTGMYTARHGDEVDRLVLYAPVYSAKNDNWTRMLADPNQPDKLKKVGAYRSVTREQADKRWLEQIPESGREVWRSQKVFDSWYDELLSMEPAPQANAIKAPNGVLVDLWEVFNARPVYDASEINVPTMVIRGDNDPTSTDEDARGLYAKLSSNIKRYVIVGEGTHFLSLEKHAPQLFAETLLFVSEGEHAPSQ
jgi:pimeloyl-ACP methyl ester carboxylesterase